jgi:hypothetical protein
MAQTAPAATDLPKLDADQLINVWIDPNEFAPGTMNQTMYR